MAITILTGDNIDLLKQYPDNHFDSVVTDCPYGLGKEPNALKLLQDWIDHGYHEIKGKGFMGKSWDSFVPQPIFWKEVFRVLKPGGYVLAFFGTRTYDWGTMAIRLAGFEIRDMICWHYGSGFPKSLNVSIAIDKHLGAERKVVGRNKNGSATGSIVTTGTGSLKREFNATEAATEAVGWGTALKPATEPICVARKPLIGTVAENVLKYGTGGINIDGCRIETDEIIEDTQKINENQSDHLKGLKYRQGGNGNGTINSAGRFPANVIFDEFMGDVLDEQTGVLTSGKPCGKRNAQSNIYGVYQTGQDVTGYGDSGGSSRFFFNAKYSEDELLFCSAKAIFDTWKIKIADIVESLSLQLSQVVFFALRLAVTEALPGGNLLNNFPDQLSMIGTWKELNRISITLITAILIIEKNAWLGLLQERRFQTGCHVRLAEMENQTGTMMITISHWKLDGFAEDVILSYTPPNLVHGVRDLASDRFMYCAKASQEERNLGCEQLDEQLGKMMGEFSDDVEKGNYRERLRTNFHPTVKPISLIRYLQRLVTPKGGVCLDPFAGSGTSGCSAYFEDIGEMVLMEMDETYIPIIEARTKYWSILRNRMNYLDEIKRQKQEVIESQMKLF